MQFLVGLESLLLEEETFNQMYKDTAFQVYRKLVLVTNISQKI